MVAIKYETINKGQGSKCFTRCPFDKHKEKRDVVYVNSGWCYNKCRWFEDIDEREEIVYCNHPKGRIKKLKAIKEIYK